MYVSLSLKDGTQVRRHSGKGGLTVGIAEVWVVQTLQDGVGDMTRVDRRVVPRLDDRVDGVLDNDLGDFTCGLV